MAFQRFMLRRRQTAAVGLWRGVYVLIARVGALSFLRIMHRRVQTAAVGLCRGVYVFIGRVEAGSMIGNMSYNSRGDALTTVYGFLRGLLMYLQPEYNCISRETVSYTSRGTIPHIVTNYPRAYIQRRTEHFRGCLQTPVLNPPKADFSIRCACNQTRVCRRKCSDRRHPNESVPTEGLWPADSDGRVMAGGFRRKCSGRRHPAVFLFPFKHRYNVDWCVACYRVRTFVDSVVVDVLPLAGRKIYFSLVHSGFENRSYKVFVTEHILVGNFPALSIVRELIEHCTHER